MAWERPASRGAWPNPSPASSCSSRRTKIHSSSASTRIRARLHFRPKCSFLFQRARQLEEVRQEDLFGAVRVADYLLEKDRLFARVTLDDAEYALYERVYERVVVDAPKPDLVVYLQAPVDVLMDRIAKRGIRYEQHIERSYLEKLTQAYARFFHSYDAAPLLIVNSAAIDPGEQRGRLSIAVRRDQQGATRQAFLQSRPAVVCCPRL